MSQYDAAAMPMYASFGTKPDATPFSVIHPLIDVNAKNTKDSYGAKQSSKMNLREVDRAPMHALNEIIWKSIKGKGSTMPPPVHRFSPLADASESKTCDKDDDHDPESRPGRGLRCLPQSGSSWSRRHNTARQPIRVMDSMRPTSSALSNSSSSDRILSGRQPCLS
jgi:hypothetical protein